MNDTFERRETALVIMKDASLCSVFEMSLRTYEYFSAG